MKKLLSLLIAATVWLSGTGITFSQTPRPDFSKMSTREIVQYIKQGNAPYIEGTRPWREFMDKSWGVRDVATFKSSFPRTLAYVEKRFFKETGKSLFGETAQSGQLNAAILRAGSGLIDVKDLLWDLSKIAFLLLAYNDDFLEADIILDLQVTHPEYTDAEIRRGAEEMSDEVWLNKIGTGPYDMDSAVTHFYLWLEDHLEARENLADRLPRGKKPNTWIQTRTPSGGGFNWNCPPEIKGRQPMGGGNAPRTRPVDPNLPVPDGEDRDFPGDSITVIGRDPCSTGTSMRPN